MAEVTQILSRAQEGDCVAAERLLSEVYDELRKLASAKLAMERPGQTLQATALVHEAYVRVMGKDKALKWNSRNHFFCAAAEAMRRILIDQARKKGSIKGGGKLKRLPLDEAGPQVAAEGESALDLLALDVALGQFELEEPLKAKLVKLRYFAGATLEQAAEILEISPATAKRYWIYARAWLFERLSTE